MSEYDIFISHSELDSELIESISSALKRIGLTAYVEENVMNYGEKIVESVCEAIDESDSFLVVLTDVSVRSQWVNQEIGYAFAKDQEIIPVRVGKIAVSGMISGIKGIKSKSASRDEILRKIIEFIINEQDIDTFDLECERCGEESRWELPTQEDKFDWDRKQEPFIRECGECEHENKINPHTLLSC